MTNLDSVLKSRYITLLTKLCIVKAMVFPVVIYGCESWDYKEGWVPKNWCFWTVVLEKPLENPLDCKKIQPVHPKRNQSWIFTGRTDAEAETPILWPPDANSWLTGKRPWCWERLKAGVEGDNRGQIQQMVGWFTNSMDMSLSKLAETMKDREAWQSMGSQRLDRTEWPTSTVSNI